MTPRRALEARDHMLRLRAKLRVAPAARLALHRDLVGNDVAGEPSLDRPEVCRRLLVDTPEPHRGDRLAGDADRADALLGTESGMRFETVHGEGHAIRRRPLHHQLVDAVAIEHEAAARTQPADVEMLGAEQPLLFADGEEDVDRAVRDAALAKDPHGFQDGGDASLVVAA